MNVLVTGACGFIGRNLISVLSRMEGIVPLLFDIGHESALLDDYAAKCDFVFHLAGVNRSENQGEYQSGNVGFTDRLLDTLRKRNSGVPIVFTSSIQAALDNEYGRSKRAAEDSLRVYSDETGATAYCYRLPNVFGKWSRPNYNSAVATLCSRIARSEAIEISDPVKELSLIYIDDVVDIFIDTMKDRPAYPLPLSPVYKITLGAMAEMLRGFQRGRTDLCIPDSSNGLEKKIYATYLTYIPQDALACPADMRADERGSFTELIRTPDRGQISINITRPGFVKGNHWHRMKNEKFIVVHGSGVIRMRNIYDNRLLEYPVNGSEIKIVDIPPGYAHHMENVGECDLVTIIWCNECFDSINPDTYYEKV